MLWLQPSKIVAEGERSLAKIQEDKLRLQEHPGSGPMDISPSRQSNLMVELEKLQMRVAQLQVQNEELVSSPKRQAIGSGAAPDRGSRLREDFVPACDEDVVRWLRDRQLDMQDATTVGNAHELARLCQVVASAVEGLSQISNPSMVANAVRGHRGSASAV